MDIIFDMETSDPDDVLTLCLLATHPAVSLVAVTVTPGSREQIGIVKHVLARVGRGDLPAGARNPDSEKSHVSEFHFDWLGRIAPAEPDAVAHELLATTFRTHRQAVLLTGAALHNARLLLNNHEDIRITRWVGQGGFAGDSVVAPEHRLDKFAGLETCPTFNFNGDPKGALMMLESERIERRELVSKNVCHGVIYDRAMHERMEPYRHQTAGLAAIYEGMSRYLEKRPEGKAFHDPLAACVAIDPRVVTTREVEVYRQKGEWGSRLATGTRTFISVAVDRELFFATMVRDA